ncbi:MAG: CvpA family protein [Stygiobacter sp.]|uniref:CvpA family protein n=1 Tax=Stygiobacter electus TaxID=3032292 RepID=A0AAE3TC24_9BACT|nr:CvpA family protein [Stygiobacter electus]MDF1611460.1 CvpA family protein [Stygiobacter electus]
MIYLDYIILAIVIIGFLLGFKDGLIRKLIGLLGFIIAVALAFEFNNKVGKIILPFFNNDEYLSNLIAGILIFIIVILITSILKRIIHPLDKVNKFINQFLGGIVGVIQVLFFTSAFLILLNILGIPSNEDKKNSVSVSMVENLIPNTIEFFIGHKSKASDFIKEYIEKSESDTTTQKK